jgi:hypothetical protein
MNTDAEEKRFERLAALLREAHVTPIDAYREDLAKRPNWKTRKKKCED